MIIKEERDKIILSDLDDFEPFHVFECGQAFRWEKDNDGSYTAVHKNRVINVSKESDKVILKNTNERDFHEIWHDYFDLGTDYTSIKDVLQSDPIMKTAIEFGHGIRILNQDEYEMLISFMISANNRIPMIKKVIENLSVNLGEKIGEFNGKMYYSFPTPQKLSEAPIELIKECKAGFRSERIKQAAARMDSEKDILYSLKDKKYDEALDYLMTFNGVGNKVANCILLFSMKQFSTFPVDVWVRRVMHELYLPSTTSDKMIRDFAENKFGNLCGYAQQYLFFYAREKGVKN